MESAPPFCQRCGNPLTARALSCPGCGLLVYGQQAGQLIHQANEADQLGRTAEAASLREQALRLLPPDSQEARNIGAQMRTAEQVRAAPGPARDWKRVWGPLGVAGALLWKFKAIVLLVFSKAKFLLFGFTKFGSFASMFASFGLYLTMYSWKFALGLVLSIYLHEMGHVAAYRRLGIPVSAPMFIPGFGAFVRGQYAPADAAGQAQVSIAGPLWGMGAALLCFGLAAATGDALWGALATVGAQINLLNLIPISILDGAGAIAPMDRTQRWLAAGAAGALWWITGTALFALILAGLGWQLYRRQEPDQPHWPAALNYIGLLAALGIMASVPVRTGF
jgi:Zn-dependent protease